MTFQKEIISATNCPNCWGHQDYECVAITPIISHQKNVINKVIKDGFIRQFVTRFVDGIRNRRTQKT